MCACVRERAVCPLTYHNFIGEKVYISDPNRELD